MSAQTTDTLVRIVPKLIPLFQGKARYRVAHGGRGSGKTRTFAKMSAVIGFIAGQAGREGIILCGREFMNSLDDSSLEEIKAGIASEPFLAAYYEVGDKFIRSRDGRIRYVFSGLRHSLDSIKSKSRIILAWVDEAEHVSEMAWQKLIPTVREDGSEIWATYNPESDESPTHKRFRVNPDEDVRIVEVNYSDNPWFPEVLEQERLRDQRERPDDYDHIWEGGFRLLGEASYYGRWIVAAEREGRIGDYPYRPHLPVHTSWDIGVDDYTAIWFWQEDGQTVTVLDYYECQNEGAEQIIEAALPEYDADLKRAARSLIGIGRDPWAYGNHYFPHDVKVREWGAGARSRVETLMGLGLRNIVKGAQLGPEERINASRRLLPLTRFNNTKRVQVGISRLRRYSRKLNELMNQYTGPLKDGNDHGADAFGEYAVNCPLSALPEPKVKKPWKLQPGVPVKWPGPTGRKRTI